jgi:hypothetical protein
MKHRNNAKREKNMQRLLLLGCAVLILLAGCTFGVPYRDGKYVTDASCDKFYGDYDATLLRDSESTKIDRSNGCWNRSREKHQDYDLLFVEFDDQGWVQGAFNQRDPAESDHLSTLYSTIDEMYKASIKNGERLSFVVFVHGWQHSADALDSNVHSFRKLLMEVAHLEGAGAGKGPKTQVIGVYIGWRGKSLTIPLINNITFWERKNTAERVAQGTVQELLRWLDLLRDTGKGKDGNRNVNMLTIGHSFGGLITFESLSGELLRNAVRFKGNAAKPDDRYMSRVGDLVVIVNPAFEGARFEPLRAAGHRLRDVERDQLPVVIVATSEADWATKIFFPLARVFSTVFESTSGNEWWGEEWQATVAAVGHNARYITHQLSLCKADDEACQKARKACEGREYAFLSEFSKKGFDPAQQKPSQQYLCNGLDLRWTKQAYPETNPFWVVRTTGDIMKDHNDIFNPAMMDFVRQMYVAFIAAQRAALK